MLTLLAVVLTDDKEVDILENDKHLEPPPLIPLGSVLIPSDVPAIVCCRGSLSLDRRLPRPNEDWRNQGIEIFLFDLAPLLLWLVGLLCDLAAPSSDVPDNTELEDRLMKPALALLVESSSISLASSTIAQHTFCSFCYT